LHDFSSKACRATAFFTLQNKFVSLKQREWYSSTKPVTKCRQVDKRKLWKYLLQKVHQYLTKIYIPKLVSNIQYSLNNHFTIVHIYTQTYTRFCVTNIYSLIDAMNSELITNSKYMCEHYNPLNHTPSMNMTFFKI